MKKKKTTKLPQSASDAFETNLSIKIVLCPKIHVKINIKGEKMLTFLMDVSNLIVKTCEAVKI